MNALLPLVLSHVQDTLSHYDEPLPFGVTVDRFLDIGSSQFEKRLHRVQRARSQSLDEILYGTAEEADRTSGTRPARPPGAPEPEET
jgi:ribonucleoside-diphosphate reductase beta chain